MGIKAKDFKIIDNDLYINSNGDFEVGLSDPQHVQDIIQSFKGWWKEFPLIGVGIDFYKGSVGTIQQIKKEIKQQLEFDGYRIDDLEIGEDFEAKISGERIK